MIDWITVDPNIHFGKPWVAGTRITVQSVLELLSEGLTCNEIMENYYPDLTVEGRQWKSEKCWLVPFRFKERLD